MNWCQVIILLWAMAGLLAVTPEECEKKPAEKHCIIEYASRLRWPHTNRYVYDWTMRKCILIRWSDICPKPKADTNNFQTEDQCLDKCSGWA